MELVIAVILGVILLIKVGSDKSASAEYDKRVDEKKERSKAFENKYTSQELETMLRGYISSEANYNSVCNEVCAELEGINYDYMWSGLLNDRQLYDVPKSQYKTMYEKMLNDREIALDVLLAKRGKIASIRTAFGYRAFLNSNDKELKKAFFEYAGRIMTLVNQNGIPANLVYKYDGTSSVYVWEGSQGDKFYGRPYEKREHFDCRLIGE